MALKGEFQDRCYRGHEMVQVNTLPATGSGRRCRACNQALSTAFNWERRKGLVLTPREVDELADEKYHALVRGRGCVCKRCARHTGR